MDGNNELIYQELIKKQRKDCKEIKKFTLHDIKRISKNIKYSIFDASGCSIWDGYITNKDKINKSSYINFYFRHRKVALHRLLYENYVSELEENQYIKYNCPCKGICCNLNHMYILDTKSKIQEKDIVNIKKDESKNNEKKTTVNFD